MVKIALDAFGGDFAPSEIIKGGINVVGSDGIGGVSLVFVGDENKIKTELSKYDYDKERVEIVHAPEVIGFDEHPAEAVKTKKNSSVMVGLSLLKEGKAAAFVSAGSTGALLAGATIKVGRIRGVERPALATLLPTEKGRVLLMDSGANVDCKPSYLAQFAKMGAIYVSSVLGIKNPKVGLVNIGAEKEKGSALTKEAYELLEAARGEINFVGNVEPRDIPQGAVDVAVCDGFVGNVILKYSEGFAKSLLSMIKRALLSRLLSKIGAVLSKKAFDSLKKSFDPSEVGGAPFLGLKNLVVKAHGGADAKTIKNAVRQCKAFIDGNVTEKMIETFGKEKLEKISEVEENGI